MFQSVSCHHYPVQHAYGVRITDCGQVYLPIYVDMLGYLEGHHLTTMCGIICVCRS